MVVEHASSDNPAQWRVAILEADAMLDEFFTRAWGDWCWSW